MGHSEVELVQLMCDAVERRFALRAAGET